MQKIIIFGNSGSGKSTLAKNFVTEQGLAHLDLDTLAWEPTTPPTRKLLVDSKIEILHFINTNEDWVIEGCYADLLAIAEPFSNEIIFMNLSISDCINNAKKRSWEPHKYETKKAQDANLNMLIEWISQYKNRIDTFSKTSHKKFYNEYSGLKSMIKENKKQISI